MELFEELSALVESLQDKIVDLEAKTECIDSTPSPADGCLITAERLLFTCNPAAACADSPIADNALEVHSNALFDQGDVQVVNGDGSTSALNACGNVVVGHNEDTSGSADGSGSHNVVAGADHVCSSHSSIALGLGNSLIGQGSFTAGEANTILGDHASVSGGESNSAIGDCASVTAGKQNEASGEHSSVTAGRVNKAIGQLASVSGGCSNEASGCSSSVSGGQRGETDAAAEHGSVSGGSGNTATGPYSSVSGGCSNDASGEHSSVSGGGDNAASGDYASVSGGELNSATGEHSSVTGGLSNFAGLDHAATVGDWQKIPFSILLAHFTQFPVAPSKVERDFCSHTSLASMASNLLSHDGRSSHTHKKKRKTMPVSS